MSDHQGPCGILADEVRAGALRTEVLGAEHGASSCMKVMSDDGGKAVVVVVKSRLSYAVGGPQSHDARYAMRLCITYREQTCGRIRRRRKTKYVNPSKE